MRSKEQNTKRLESICHELLRTREHSVKDTSITGNPIRRERLDQELSIIRKRDLTEVFLLIHDCIVPVSKEYPVTVRGSAAASFVIWLFGLCHYDPVKIGSGPEIFYGADCDDETDSEMPRYFSFNMTEKARRQTVEDIMGYLQVTLPAEIRGPLSELPSVWISLRTYTRGGNRISSEEGFTHPGRGVMIDITHPDWEHMEKENVITLHRHTDMERICQLSQQAGDLPEDPESVSGVFSLFTPEKAKGLGLFGTRYIRNHILAYAQPRKLEDLIRILGLAQGHGDRVMRQLTMLREGTICLDEVVSTREDAQSDNSGSEYLFSAAHISEYVWIALVLACFRLRRCTGTE